MPRYWFADDPTLQAFLANEMLYGLRVAVEAMALSDIAGTGTIQPNPYDDASALSTLRKSVTLLEIAGHDAAAFVVSPLDWELIELSLSTTNAVEHISLPYDAAARRL